MARRQIPLTTTGLARLASGLPGIAGRAVVQVVVTGGATFSLTFRGRLTPPTPTPALDFAMEDVPLDTASPQLAYTPMTTGTLTSGSTAITAAGLYTLDCSFLDVAAHVSALTLGGGTVTLIVEDGAA